MKLLHVSANAELANARSEYLTALGFEVVDAHGVRDALTILNSCRGFEVAILCHTLSNHDKLKIAAFVQAKWAVPVILELYLAEPPVTEGIALEADTEFQPWMIRWAESRPILSVRTVGEEVLSRLPRAGARDEENELPSPLLH